MSFDSTAERTKHQTFWVLACFAVLLAQVVAEYFMGRTIICTCGYVKLWEGTVNSSGNSQHLSASRLRLACSWRW